MTGSSLIPELTIVCSSHTIVLCNQTSLMSLPVFGYDKYRYNIVRVGCQYTSYRKSEQGAVFLHNIYNKFLSI